MDTYCILHQALRKKESLESKHAKIYEHIPHITSGFEKKRAWNPNMLKYTSTYCTLHQAKISVGLPGIQTGQDNDLSYVFKTSES
jgi:hypothetical protein